MNDNLKPCHKHPSVRMSPGADCPKCDESNAFVAGMFVAWVLLLATVGFVAIIKAMFN